MGIAKDFIFGTATSSFQIEGGVKEDGRSPSIWDDFCQIPGRVLNGHTGETACDHYHRYKEDIARMYELGADSYRFSISWSRIFPQQGVYNPKGMEFYKGILKELKRYHMTAMVTLYHWDLPSWAQNMGGWLNRESVNWFEEYCVKCFEELDQEVDFFITHNEPFCASFVSYFEGRHAPGHKNLEEAVKAAHHILLSHGRAVQVYRKYSCKKQIGIALNMTPAYAASGSFADQLAANNRNGYICRWFLDAVFKGSYPTDMVNLYAGQCKIDFSFIEAGDLKLIAEPCDFLGINYYFRDLIEYDLTNILLSRKAYFSNYKQTAMGWDIGAEEFIQLITWIRKEYTELPVYITENGSAWEDVVEHGEIHDTDRAEYLIKHLEAVEQMNDNGLLVKGYYYWSFLDNFEWAWGYSKRFGLVYVDYETQERKNKDSFYAYQSYISQAKQSKGNL
jgi:beta-glucosidase